MDHLSRDLYGKLNWFDGASLSQYQEFPKENRMCKKPPNWVCEPHLNSNTERSQDRSQTWIASALLLRQFSLGALQNILIFLRTNQAAIISRMELKLVSPRCNKNCIGYSRGHWIIFHCSASPAADCKGNIAYIYIPLGCSASFPAGASALELMDLEVIKTKACIGFKGRVFQVKNPKL